MRSLGLLAIVLLFAACAPAPDEPIDVDLEQLVAEQDTLDGSVVRASGVVRMHDDPLHYWIEDERQNRVELLPHDDAAPLLGDEVEVVGRFTFDDARGRVIEVESIHPVGDRGPA